MAKRHAKKGSKSKGGKKAPKKKAKAKKGSKRSKKRGGGGHRAWGRCHKCALPIMGGSKGMATHNRRHHHRGKR